MAVLLKMAAPLVFFIVFHQPSHGGKSGSMKRFSIWPEPEWKEPVYIKEVDPGVCSETNTKEQPAYMSPVLPGPPRPPGPAVPYNCGTVSPKGDFWSSQVQLTGRPSPDGSWPWTVSIMKIRKPGNWPHHHCTGVLISDRWVLTAAHCFKDKERLCEFRVLIGEANIKSAFLDSKFPTIRQIDQIIKHKDYNFGTEVRQGTIPVIFPVHDIALVKLSESVTDSPVCLQDPTESTVSGTCHEVQWKANEMHHPGIEHASAGTLTPRECTTGAICRTNRNTADACHGDSGAPVVCGMANGGGWTLVGITSHSSSMKSNCDNDSMQTMMFRIRVSSEHKTVFTSTKDHMTWIQNNINRNNY